MAGGAAWESGGLQSERSEVDVGVLFKSDWNGWSGAPGVTTMYITNGASYTDPPTSTALSAAATAVRTFFDGIKAYLPSMVTISWSGSAVMVNDDTGVLEDAVTYTPPATVTGTAVTAWAAPAGFSIRLNTADVVNGRALTGRIFIVPASGASTSTDGTLAPGCLTAAQSAINTLIAASEASSEWKLSVWHRPQSGTAGTHGLVHSASVKDVVAVLTSRRD